MEAKTSINTGILIQGIDAPVLMERLNAIEQAISKINQTPQSETTTLLTRKEVTQILKISLVTLHNWSKKGLLTPHRIGNKIRFNKAEVLNRFNTERKAQ